jgi:hypothetical protein
VGLPESSFHAASFFLETSSEPTAQKTGNTFAVVSTRRMRYLVLVELKDGKDPRVNGNAAVVRELA